MSEIKIADARVLVTGAGSGIGRAIALRCAREGAEIIAVDIDGDTAAETAEMCRGEITEASSYECDVSSHDAVEALAEEVESERGAIDVAVNNAGVGLYGRFLDGAPEDWDWLMGVNLDGVVNGCRAFGSRMIERRSGHVVNIASGAGYIPNRQHGRLLHVQGGCRDALAMLARRLGGARGWGERDLPRRDRHADRPQHADVRSRGVEAKPRRRDARPRAFARRRCEGGRQRRRAEPRARSGRDRVNCRLPPDAFVPRPASRAHRAIGASMTLGR